MPSIVLQAPAIIRRLRPNSSPTVAATRSRATASGAYTGRQPRFDQLEGERDVLAAGRLEEDVRVPSHGVDRAVPGGHAREAATPIPRTAIS